MRFYLIFIFSLFLTFSSAQAEVKELALANGKTALIMPAQSLPMTLIQLTFPEMGSVSDPMGKAGRAYLAAAMLKEGAGKMDGAAFREALENKAIELSVSARQEKLTITLQSLESHVPEALQLVRLMLTQARFDVSAFEKVKRQALSTLKQRSQNPNWAASIEFDKLVYGDHPLAQPAIGTRQSLKELKRADLQRWYKQLSSQKLIISAAGEMNQTMMKRELSEIITALPKAPSVAIEVKPIGNWPQAKMPKKLVQKIPQTVAMFGLEAPSRDDPDFYAAYVMNHILGGGGLTSRLSQAIRQQKGLAYSAGSYLSVGKYRPMLMGSFATRNESALEALEIAKDVMQQFAEKGSTKEETQNAIDYLTGSFPLNLDNLQSQVSYLTSMQYYGLGKDYLEKRNDYFRAVTHEDVSRVAAKILAKPPLVVLVGDPKGD